MKVEKYEDIHYFCNIIRHYPERETWIKEYVDIVLYLKVTDKEYWKLIRKIFGFNRSIRRKSEIIHSGDKDIYIYTNYKCYVTLELLDFNRLNMIFFDHIEFEVELSEKILEQYQVKTLSDLYEISEKKTIFDEKCYRVLFTNDWVNDSKEIQYVACPVGRVITRI
ncbi:hypothetical protein [Brevibacillus massiliensis]|uniref:hypothetical protein n=1 Tax=Brevibacillus massiliensis TaxID=1118054 RepID=UPI00037EC51F|nr:hypothetical protein [Brevibacillus massiliensis]